MDNAAERAIECIRERYGEPLTLTEIAESALLSRFYFARLFKEETGITPGRFLAAIRIHEAKRLIKHTSMSIIDISYAVGYNSLGSFTNSFTSGVGVSPSRYRRLSRDGGDGLPGPEPDLRAGYGTIAGTISLPAGHGNARVFLGAFGTPVVQHPSVASAVVDVPAGRPSCYVLQNVPEGEWHLLAVAVADGIGPEARTRRTALVAGRGPATVPVTAGVIVSAAVRLRPVRATDPPVLLALPELVPPAEVVSHPGCVSLGPQAEPVAGGRRDAGHLKVASAAPEPAPVA
ncbi:AraC family transcriptional regulator [Streptomyces brevispora]|uniref:AraC family transcriptional regulator n=1 Tax=Streptomyces brevispora TaxID=887462 RepID=A0ABZ1GE44_9ACTN|nr:AraC family transcriptional regulator [Streptomyces brevispora]WSC11593.1 AraC family transcriptional regulator [Streptomyces brevispora]WSC17518.1 AraC family transcriptional regulator [Streptomyces brevispora]